MKYKNILDNDDFYSCHDTDGDTEECLKHDECKNCPYYYEEVSDNEL